MGWMEMVPGSIINKDISREDIFARAFLSAVDDLASISPTLVKIHPKLITHITDGEAKFR
jgi:hypothetical protein